VLCAAISVLGSSFSAKELKTIVEQLDEEDLGEIEFDDFATWWVQKHGLIAYWHMQLRYYYCCISFLLIASS
jgi:hypothetical protein